MIFDDADERLLDDEDYIHRMLMDDDPDYDDFVDEVEFERLMGDYVPQEGCDY